MRGERAAVKTALQPAAERARERGVRLPAELVLDRYRLCERLGSGGFGTVYRGHDERLDREVAVKRIPRTRRGDCADRANEDGRRAAREALAAARLGHPSIVALYEAGADDDAYYIVSELVHGCTLAELYGSGILPDARVVAIAAELAGALAHAHARGIVHRDVKPQNVIVPGATADADPHEDPASHRGDARATVKLTDFGIARIAGSAPLTHTGDIVGTLAYMAPEQAEGRPAGPAADLYSLALVVYEGLAGANPVRGDSPAETARRLGRPIPSLQRARRDLPPALCAAIDRALCADPQRRGSLVELRDALLDASTEVAADTVRPRPQGRRRDPERAPAPAPRERLAAAAGAALLGVSILAWAGPQLSVPAWWGLLAGAAVALAPRAGWLASAAAAVTWLLSAGEPGTALLLALALLPVPLLLPRAPALWSLPLLAPALGAITCALAFPAVAGLLRGAWRRAAVAALGIWWLLLAEPLLGRRLLLGVAAGTRDRAAWRGSATDFVGHALVPLVRGAAPSVAVAWALAALILPWIVRGRSPSLDAFAAAVWAAGAAAATVALVTSLARHRAPIDPLWLAPGGLAAVVVIVLACALRGRLGRAEGAAHPL